MGVSLGEFREDEKHGEVSYYPPGENEPKVTWNITNLNQYKGPPDDMSEVWVVDRRARAPSMLIRRIPIQHLAAWLKENGYLGQAEKKRA
jgi:hypothetical protein